MTDEELLAFFEKKVQGAKPSDTVRAYVTRFRRLDALGGTENLAYWDRVQGKPFYELSAVFVRHAITRARRNMAKKVLDTAPKVC